jgi:hypothetical protein
MSRDLPALRRSWTRSLACVLTFLSLGLVGLGQPASASARPFPDATPSASGATTGLLSLPDGGLAAGSKRLSLAACNALVQKGIIFHPAGWTFSCSSTRVGKNENGWTYRRETVIRPGMTLAKTKLVLAHEEAHIWSLSTLTPAQMTWFSRQLGKKSFFDGNAKTMPAEVWAASQAACAGYRQTSYRLVPCALLSETLRH